MYSAAEEAANSGKWRKDSPRRAAALGVCALLARRTAESAADAPSAMRTQMSEAAGKYYREWRDELRELAHLARDIFGNPFHPVTFLPEWRTSTVLALAQQMYDSREFSAMPILADALQDAGCDNADILDHCRGPGPHVRGCWVVDLVLSKE